jgi:hypothetical protein
MCCTGIFIMEWLGVDGWWLCGTGISFHRGGVGVDGIRLDNVQRVDGLFLYSRGRPPWTPLSPAAGC